MTLPKFFGSVIFYINIFGKLFPFALFDLDRTKFIIA